MKRIILAIVVLMFVVSAAWAADQYTAKEAITITSGEKTTTVQKGEVLPSWTPAELIKMFLDCGQIEKVEVAK